MSNDSDTTENRKTVGVYDRPASADRPKMRPFVIVAVVIVLVVAGLYLMRRWF